jgi:hypothetical protein
MFIQAHLSGLGCRKSESVENKSNNRSKYLFILQDKAFLERTLRAMQVV